MGEISSDEPAPFNTTKRNSKDEVMVDTAEKRIILNSSLTYLPIDNPLRQEWIIASRSNRSQPRRTKLVL